MPLTVLDGPTIKKGQSLSDGIDCSGGEIVRITCPREYNDGDEPSLMTFQVSSDGNLYNDLFNDAGHEISIVARANTGVVVNKAFSRAIGFLKIRSGTRDAQTLQKEDCKLAIAISTP